MATPEEHTEMLRLLRENNDLAQQNNKLLRTLYRHSVIGFITRVIWFIILIGLPFALYFTILEPYFEAFGSNYGTFRAGIGEIPGLKGLEQMMQYFEHGTGTSSGQ
jgi:hypothetical protein